MATSPNYASTPTVGAAMLTTGDTSRTAPSSAATIFTPGALGGSVERIVIQPVATTTASTVRIFRHDGSAYHLYAEVALPALAASGSTPLPNQTLEAVDNPNLFPIALPTNWTLRATVNDTQTGVQIQAEGGSF